MIGTTVLFGFVVDDVNVMSTSAESASQVQGHDSWTGKMCVDYCRSVRYSASCEGGQVSPSLVHKWGKDRAQDREVRRLHWFGNSDQFGWRRSEAKRQSSWLVWDFMIPPSPMTMSFGYTAKEQDSVFKLPKWDTGGLCLLAGWGTPLGPTWWAGGGNWGQGSLHVSTGTAANAAQL